eukprot:scaffold110628_cov30-Tisochrysis_lutea.AAC.9
MKREKGDDAGWNAERIRRRTVCLWRGRWVAREVEGKGNRSSERGRACLMENERDRERERDTRKNPGGGGAQSQSQRERERAWLTCERAWSAAQWTPRKVESRWRSSVGARDSASVEDRDSRSVRIDEAGRGAATPGARRILPAGAEFRGLSPNISFQRSGSKMILCARPPRLPSLLSLCVLSYILSVSSSLFQSLSLSLNPPSLFLSLSPLFTSSTVWRVFRPACKRGVRCLQEHSGSLHATQGVPCLYGMNRRWAAQRSKTLLLGSHCILLATGYWGWGMLEGGRVSSAAPRHGPLADTPPPPQLLRFCGVAGRSVKSREAGRACPAGMSHPRSIDLVIV